MSNASKSVITANIGSIDTLGFTKVSGNSSESENSITVSDYSVSKKLLKNKVSVNSTTGRPAKVLQSDPVSPQPIENWLPEISIGHIGFRVSSLEDSIRFYKSVLRMEIIHFYKHDYAHLSLPGSKVHALTLVEKESVSQAAKLTARVSSTVGGHVAFEVSKLIDFYFFAKEIESSEITKCKILDHETSWAIYVDDPDKNRIEIFFDRRSLLSDKNAWTGTTKHLSMSMIEETLSE